VEAHGWRLFQYPLFEQQLYTLTEAVEKLSKSAPENCSSHPKTKLLAAIRQLVRENIPRNPSGPEFRQGDTLGPDNRHWFRAKFHQRYRLFFRFSTKERVIVYVWMNDESTLRKAGSRTDPYSIFRKMLSSGDPPRSLDELVRRSKEIEL
jgi:toxin YhaV